MEHLSTNTSIWTAFKNSSYVLAFVAFSEYLDLAPESVGILTALIVLDIATGIAKSGILYGWRSICSSRLASGILAKMLLLLVPISLALAGKGVGMDLSILVQSAITVLILSQVYSIIGNIHAVQTKTDKNEFDAVAFIMHGVRDFLERFMEKNSVEKKP